jgi:hypothetical protein
MAKDYLDSKSDPSKSERVCVWCGGGIAGLMPHARFCSSICRERDKTYSKALKNGHWPRERVGPRPAGKCPECGSLFERFDPRQIYCVHNGTCAQAAYRKSEACHKRLESLDVRLRIKLAARRHASSPQGKAAQKCRDALPHNIKRRNEYAMSEHGRGVKREYQRLTQASAAISAILLPVQKHPEV